MRLYGILVTAEKRGAGDYLMREIIPPFSEAEEPAVLCFTDLDKAKQRAACAYGYDNYEDVEQDGWCKVVVIADDTMADADLVQRQIRTILILDRAEQSIDAFIKSLKAIR